MTSFIFDVLDDLNSKGLDFTQLTFVLPSKRAGIFLKHQLPQVVNQTIFSPIILSIEDFIGELSQLKSISNTELLFEFYKSYIQETPKEELETFDSFSKWAQVILQDFNEIDRFLIDQKKIFDYLNAIKEIEHYHWSLDENKTEFIKNYLSFWNKLQTYYDSLSINLLKNKKGYQGLIYREAVENLESYIQNTPRKLHVFLGFNALNKAEEIIIQELLQNDLAFIYWDFDQAFYNNKYHDATLFAKQYKEHWNYFKNNPFNWISNNYSKDKNISVVGVPKNIGQAKYIGSILKNLNAEKNNLNNTAVILGDENLLIPVLSSIPESVNSINITMGFPLKSVPLAILFEQLFHIHKKSTKTFYYKDIISLLSNQYISPLFTFHKIDYASIIIQSIQTNNLVYITTERLIKIAKPASTLINLLFKNWNNDIESTLNNCQILILKLKGYLDLNKSENLITLEYLYRFNELFNELIRLNEANNFISDNGTLHSIYNELISSEQLDFKGEPLEGLQIMGMLESRVLDFDNVIISSVNEGILPSGKSNNSFIPFDVKLSHNLPTYKEKDAVYTYHFYKLLQRAKNVYIIYNTQAEVITGGEKSRFITQLELEGVHNIKQHIVSPKVPKIENTINSIVKNGVIIQKLEELAKKGFSPSALTNYIRNPLDFYYQKILGVSEDDNIEETVAANTLGTVIHNTLEDLYKPYINVSLTECIMKDMKQKIEEIVSRHFKKEFKEGNINKGKNLIIFEIAKRYVSNFLDFEINTLNAGNSIKILAVEQKIEVEINIPKLNFPVKLKGTVDRIDEFNGALRIIDYKSGKVEQNKVKVTQWEAITTDYTKYSKSFQILMYAYMMNLKDPFNSPIEAGIISFKNLKSGFLKFSKSNNSLITHETLDSFYLELEKLILEIFNPEIDFFEKEV